MQLLRPALALAALAVVATCQAPVRVTDFQAGPTALGMYIYVPRSPASPAPIVVAVHHCQGSATGYAQETHYQALADAHGFLVVYPSARTSGGCFDVSSAATLTHDGGGDSKTIANMVAHAVAHYDGDAKRVFATGSSSGAMMAQVLAGAYPDVFAAVSVYSGVPDGCFAVAGATAAADPPGWNSDCANGRVTKTAQEWGDLVRSYYPGYAAARPRMQIWHGTVDATLRYPNYQESLKQWSNVLGLTATSSTADNTPQSQYTRTMYGSGSSKTAQLVGYSAANVGHTVPVHEQMDIDFFGLSA